MHGLDYRVDQADNGNVSPHFRPRFRFFTPNALENGHSFAGQHDKYIKLFQSVDDINLDIGILSSSMEDQNIQLKGRFRINLTYPQAQTIQRKGQIFFYSQTTTINTWSKN